jgi:hypothetical protein
MRTTLTIDPDVGRLIEDEVHRSRKSFKQVVNDAIRRGLSPVARATPSAPYRVKAHVAKLAAGFDRQRFNALVDELDDTTTIAKLDTRSKAAERKR